MPSIPLDLDLPGAAADANLDQNAPGSINPAGYAVSRSFFWAGVILLALPGLLYAYLLMPFPGSQNLNAITVCYYLAKIIMPLRLAGTALIIFYLVRYFRTETKKFKLTSISVLIICGVLYFFTDVQYKAEKMFEEPKTIKFENGLHNKVPESSIILGVVFNGVAKAYPITYLGYHHKIQDNVGGKAVLVTYCTMCRTAQIFNPVINGRRQNFRLVGARHYNAIIEDAGTHSWWYQATGLAAAGPLKGNQLQVLAYEQSTLSAWLDKHPASLILQPDKLYKTSYLELKNYDRIQAVDKDSTLRNKDSLVRKSWVLGVVINKQAKAYNWRQLVKYNLINDNVAGNALLVGVEKDGMSFHTWNRVLNGKELHFSLAKNGSITDQETASVWNWDGLCVSGLNEGKRLDKIQAYQEYWHSWKYFYPETLYQEKIL